MKKNKDSKITECSTNKNDTAVMEKEMVPIVVSKLQCKQCPHYFR